jgi:hypothetical protein
MKPILYSLQFRGQATGVAPHVVEARASAPSSILSTIIDEDGVSGRFEKADGDEAVLDARLVRTGDGSLDATGTIVFGLGNVIRFRTLGTGRISASPDPHLEHGTLVGQIEGGEGRFADASGRITSNFLVSDTGELTDNHLGLIFVPDIRGDEG